MSPNEKSSSDDNRVDDAADKTEEVGPDQIKEGQVHYSMKETLYDHMIITHFLSCAVTAQYAVSAYHILQLIYLETGYTKNVNLKMLCYFIKKK